MKFTARALWFGAGQVPQLCFWNAYGEYVAVSLWAIDCCLTGIQIYKVLPI